MMTSISIAAIKKRGDHHLAQKRHKAGHLGVAATGCVDPKLGPMGSRDGVWYGMSLCDRTLLEPTAADFEANVFPDPLKSIPSGCASTTSPSTRARAAASRIWRGFNFGCSTGNCSRVVPPSGSIPTSRAGFMAAL
jgi:hypothetical protein